MYTAVLILRIYFKQRKIRFILNNFKENSKLSLLLN